MRLLAVVILMGAFTYSYAQNDHTVDSLTHVLSSTKNSARFDVLYELGFAYMDKGDFEHSLHFIREADSVATRYGDSLKIVKAARVKGQILNRLARTNEAIFEFKKALPISKRNKFDSEYESILNGLAVAYTWQANYDKALQYNFEALILREKRGNKVDISVTLNNIGVAYYKVKNYEKALEYYKRAFEQTEDITFRDKLLINIGLCYNELHDFTAAEKYISDGMKLCAPNCTEPTILQGEYGLGVSLLSRGKAKEAREHFRTSLQLSKNENDKRFQIENLVYLARIGNAMGDYDVVKERLIEAEEVAAGTLYNELLISIYAQYSDLYNRTKDYQNAALYQGKYIKLRDSIYSEELIKNMARVQTNYEERENLKTIADKDAVLALKEETLKRQRTENVFYVIVSVMVFVLAILMLMLFRLTRKANERLEERVDVRTKELNDSNDALTKVNGEMDNFIYKTSHDIRGPLASLKGICNVAIMDVSDGTALGYLKKLDSTADKLNMILTRLLIINQINHAVLAANVINFEEIIEEILLLEHKKGVPKRLNISYKVEKGLVVKSDKEMLRIVMENLIDNSIKFYNESERIEPFVRIHVGADKENLVITVIDNGVGINEETKEKIFHMFVRASERSETGGIGLYLAKLATGRLEGTIDFSTTREKHTEFILRLPFDLGPLLEVRKEQDRIREFEKMQNAKQKPVSTH